MFVNSMCTCDTSGLDEAQFNRQAYVFIRLGNFSFSFAVLYILIRLFCRRRWHDTWLGH